MAQVVSWNSSSVTRYDKNNSARPTVAIQSVHNPFPALASVLLYLELQMQIRLFSCPPGVLYE